MIELLEGLIRFELPSGWEWHPDDSGGGAIPLERDCVLHIRAERVRDAAELPNLSRMLAGFLTEHVTPVATDELRAFQVEEVLGFAWQYREEWEDEGERAVRVWVLGNELAWCFVSFQGPIDSVQRDLQLVDNAIVSFRFARPES